jgi:hypothetical protein
MFPSSFQKPIEGAVMAIKINLVGLAKGIQNFFAPEHKKGCVRYSGEHTEKPVVNWGWCTQLVHKDDNFIEFYDAMGELWYQRFSIDWGAVSHIKDLDHEIQLLYIVCHEFKKDRCKQIAFYARTGDYVTVRGMENSTGEVWKILMVKNRLTNWTLRKIYQSVRL